MIIKGHWGGVGPLRLPWICTDPERFENLRWTLPETSCMTSTFKHLASCCPPPKKQQTCSTYLKNMFKSEIFPQVSGCKCQNVYLKPPNGWISSSFRNWLISKELIVSNFQRICLAHATLQKGVKKTTSITSPNDGLPWLASTRPRCCLLGSSFFSYTYTTILRKFHPFLLMSVSTSVNDFAKFATRHKLWDLVIMIYFNRWSKDT